MKKRDHIRILREVRAAQREALSTARGDAENALAILSDAVLRWSTAGHQVEDLRDALRCMERTLQGLAE